MPTRPLRTTNALVTKILIAANVLVYLITVAQGSGLNSPGGKLFLDWILYGPFVAHGDWWRLVTAMFLHGGVIHIAFNMLALWWFALPSSSTSGAAASCCSTSSPASRAPPAR